MTKNEKKAAQLLAEKNKQGGGNAPGTDNAGNGTNGTEGNNEGGGNAVIEGDAETEGEKQPPAAIEGAAEVVVKKIAKKSPPLKHAKRTGGGRTAHSGEPTYNIGIVAYNELVVDAKTKELKHVPHILNGNHVFTFNGDPAGEVNKELPVFKTLDEALAANAIEFGMKVDEKEMVKLYGYAQNVKLIEGGYPTTGKKDKAGKLLQYSCFITATAKNYEAVVANMKAYLESPYSAGNRSLFELLPAPFALTYPVVAPATIGGEAKKEGTEVVENA